jgi:hypothetical protein
MLAVQLVDTQLDQLAGERKRLPERASLAAATARRDAWAAEEARLRAVVTTASDEIATAEREGSALDAKRARLEAQLKTVSTERQADALTHEIESIRQQHSDLDDRELAAMEAQGDAESGLITLHGQWDDIAAAVATATAELERAVERLAAQEADLTTRRRDADAALTDAERALYSSLRARFGGIGIAQLEGRRCTGCHLDLSAKEADVVQHAPADELAECPHCGRVLAR